MEAIRSSTVLGFTLALVFANGCVEHDDESVELRSGLANGHISHCELDAIELPGSSLYPEGITSDRQTGTLYLGSMAEGSLSRVRPCASELETVAPPGTFRNVVGVAWDSRRDAVWVCNTDLGFASPPRLELVDPDEGSVIASHDFGAIGFCNDITFVDGDVLATDSLGHRIVRVAADDVLDDTPVETWAAPPEFDAGPGFSLNGLAYDGKHALYVAYIPTGSIFRAELDDEGEFTGVTELELDAALAGPDGLYWRWTGKDELVLVESGTHRISSIELDGDAGTLEVLDDGLDFPTTAAKLGDSAWVLEGKLDHLFGIDPNPVDLPFRIVRVDL
jgi:sugar lactone lactonase YvrE